MMNKAKKELNSINKEEDNMEEISKIFSTFFSEEQI